MYSKDPEWLSIGEAAELIQVSRDTLRRWEKKGKIKSYRSPTNRRMYKRSELTSLYQITDTPSSDVQKTSYPQTSSTEPQVESRSSTPQEPPASTESVQQPSTPTTEPTHQIPAPVTPQVPVGLSRPAATNITPQINPFSAPQTPSTNPFQPTQINQSSMRNTPSSEHSPLQQQSNHPQPSISQPNPAPHTTPNTLNIPPKTVTPPNNQSSPPPRNPFINAQQYQSPQPQVSPTYTQRQQTYNTVAQQQALNTHSSTTTVVGVGSPAYQNPQNTGYTRQYSQTNQPASINNTYDEYDYEDEYDSTDSNKGGNLKSLKIITGILITILIFLGIGIFIIIFTSYN